ncbi:MAG TPA: DUF2231 domain-containing protein [Natronosporangium sp.]
MESRARALGHAIHPTLIVFPLGLLATAVIFDIIYLFNDREGLAAASGYMIAAGLIGGLVAAAFGLIDWLAIPAGTRAKRVGLWHGSLNVVVVALFAISWLLRLGGDGWEPGVAALIFSFAGAGVALVSAWLGGELVERLGIGVDRGAGPDASSSLRGAADRPRTAGPYR